MNANRHLELLGLIGMSSLEETDGADTVPSGLFIVLGCQSFLGDLLSAPVCS